MPNSVIFDHDTLISTMGGVLFVIFCGHNKLTAELGSDCQFRRKTWPFLIDIGNSKNVWKTILLSTSKI